MTAGVSGASGAPAAAARAVPVAAQTAEARPAAKSALKQFQGFFGVLQGAALNFPVKHEHSAPLMLDVLSGPRAPLAQAFQWLGWEVLTPLDILRDEDFDITNHSVLKAVGAWLPHLDFVSCAIECSTKSRAREIRPGPPPLRSPAHPRGLPGLSEDQADRVSRDNAASDAQLALQECVRLRGGAALRENPFNSMHWHDPVEAHLWDTGAYEDTVYHACVFHSERAKHQRLRHNIPQFRALPDLSCGHLHRDDEWRRCGSTKEEAEYTPALVFTIAITVTAWTVQQGRASLAVPRLPVLDSVGDRRHWHEFSATDIRQDMMVPVAVSLGIVPPRARKLGVPRRLVAADVLAEHKCLPVNHVYIGHGHFSHRWDLSQWESPFVIGRDGTAFEVAVRFAKWLLEQPWFPGDLSLLRGKTLVCDCPCGQLCHGDILAALFYTTASDSRPRASRPDMRAVLVATGMSMPRTVKASITQACIVEAFRRLLWFVDFHDFRFPLVEDLINSPELTHFSSWMLDNHPDQLVWGPRVGSAAVRYSTSLEHSHQPGAAAHKAAQPPWVPFNLTDDKHFQVSLAKQAFATPFEAAQAPEQDLWFAAQTTALLGPRLARVRKAAQGAFRELARRWQPVTAFLRQRQPGPVQSATAGRHIGLIFLLIILLRWPDVGLATGFMHGFPTVGHAPPCRVFAAQPSVMWTLDDVLRDGVADSRKLIRSIRPGVHDEVVAQAGRDDEQRGFCGPEMTLAQLQCLPRYRTLRRFVIEQGNGKKRVIDHAFEGGQSQLSSDASKLDLCQGTQPATHVQLLSRALQEAGQEWFVEEGEAVLSGGEDLPHAYRHTPMVPEQADGCIVAYWCPWANEVRFRRYFGHLFGLPLAVISFNRWSRFLQAIIRRLAIVLISFYFDDATFQDLASNANSAQAAVRAIAAALGSPFSEDKSQDMAVTGDFLGLFHDLSAVRTQGTVSFWIRPRLAEKIRGIVDHATTTQQLTSGTASNPTSLTYLVTKPVITCKVGTPVLS